MISVYSLIFSPTVKHYVITNKLQILNNWFAQPYTESRYLLNMLKTNAVEMLGTIQTSSSSGEFEGRWRTVPFYHRWSSAFDFPL